MKIYIKIILLLLNVIPLFSNAQESIKIAKNDNYLKRINLIINRGFKSEVLKDSIALYAINFKIDLVQKNPGKSVVTQIIANDSLAYKLFPAYKELYAINYNKLLKNRKRLTLVIPILISNISDTAKETQKNQDGNLLITMQSAVNAAYSLYSTNPYNNIEDSKVPVGHRIYKSKKDKNTERASKDIVYLNPYVVQILNIR